MDKPIIHEDTLKEFHPKSDIASVITLLGNRMLLWMELDKIVKREFKIFKNKKVPKYEIIILEKEKQISLEFEKCGIPKFRQYFDGIYYLTTPLNDLYTSLSHFEMVVDDFLEKVSFFRDGKYWTGPISGQEISDSLGIKKQDILRIVEELEESGIIEQKLYVISSNFRHMDLKDRYWNQRGFWYSIRYKKYLSRCKEHYTKEMMKKDLNNNPMMERIRYFTETYK